MSPPRTTRRRLLLGGVPTLAMLTAGCVQSNDGELDGSKYVSDWHDTPVRGGADSIESDGSCSIDLDSEAAFLEEAVVQQGISVDGASQLSQVWIEAIPEEYYGQAELGDHYSVSRVLHLRGGGGIGLPTLGNSGQEVIQTPTVSFEELVNATPRKVLRTSSEADGTSACSLPVYVKDTYVQHD